MSHSLGRIEQLVIVLTFPGEIFSCEETQHQRRAEKIICREGRASVLIWGKKYCRGKGIILQGDGNNIAEKKRNNIAEGKNDIAERK